MGQLQCWAAGFNYGMSGCNTNEASLLVGLFVYKRVWTHLLSEKCHQVYHAPNSGGERLPKLENHEQTVRYRHTTHTHTHLKLH